MGNLLGYLLYLRKRVLEDMTKYVYIYIAFKIVGRELA